MVSFWRCASIAALVATVLFVAAPEQLFWSRLLHYVPTLTGVESEADGEGFFFAPNGKQDPRAELAATTGDAA